jgi:hypothetical protein
LSFALERVKQDERLPNSIEAENIKRYLQGVPLTLDQIIEETRTWPREQLGELLERLCEHLDPIAVDIESAWKNEVRQRLAEIQDGSVEPRQGEQVSERVRRIVGQ